MTLCAVFATDHSLQRSRVTRWLDWDAAQAEWERLDDMRRDGRFSGETLGESYRDAGSSPKFFEVRSKDDPNYNSVAYEPWVALPDDQKPTWVKLSRSGREALLKVGRDAGYLDAAADAMFSELMNDPEWWHLDAITISDYAWAAARFCFPREARY